LISAISSSVPALLDTFEHFGKDLIKPVEQPFVLHIGGASEIIKFLRVTADHLGVERFEHEQMLLQ
jgi:hypothetical protein